MTAERLPARDLRLQRAIKELRGLILRHYPEARFEVRRGIDDPEAVHLIAAVDTDDLDEVVDLVIERMMEIQIEDGLPVFVIPIRSAVGAQLGSRAGRT
jgi:hypothetical protein